MINQDFLNRMKEYLSNEDYEKLLKSYEDKPTRSFRLNNVDYSFLYSLNLNTKKISYDMDGYYLYDDLKYGNHPIHHLGAIYFQEPSAMAPVNLYDFKGDEVVLDLCAAPGGKSSQILRRIPRGVLISNDPSNKRSQVLFGNLERLGYQNAIVTSNLPEELSKKLGGFFDVIMVDAPCSGEGMMRKDMEAQNQWNLNLVADCAKKDRNILIEADKMLKENGILIYSTCTFSKEEDEDVVTFLKEELNYEVLPVNDRIKEVTKEGFIPNTRRFYPFYAKGEGQFMALLQKKSPSLKTYKERKNIKQGPDYKIVWDFINENLTDFDFQIAKEGNRFYALASNLVLDGLNVLNYGIELGEVIKNRFVPYHHFFKALGSHFKNKLELELDDPRVLAYLRGEEIKADVRNGYGAIMISNLCLGGFKASNNVLKNHYPKGLRNN